MANTDVIEKRIDAAKAGELAISDHAGGLAFSDMGEVMEFSKLMAVAGTAVPKHLRGAPGTCLAVCVQALGWRMDPFAVANKSYSVNDRVAYEAQLIHAVVEQRAPIKGRIKGEYLGDGKTRQVRLWCVSAEDGDTIEYLSPEFDKITPKNSPLWKSDPDQQLWYYSARALARRHFPDVLLGVYAKDEIEDHAPMREVNPRPSLQERMEAANKPVEPEDESQDPDDAEIVPEDLTAMPQNGFPGDGDWDAGKAAFDDGVAYQDNPFISGTDADQNKADSWAGGWNAGHEASLENGT